MGGVDLGSGAGRFTVGRYSLEYEDMRMNRDLLEGLARQSGGVYASPDRLDAVLNDLELAPQPVAEAYRTRLWGENRGRCSFSFCSLARNGRPVAGGA